MGIQFDSKEVATAVKAVRLASVICREVQKRIAADGTITKEDRSPVTIADFASQAVVCKTLADGLGPVPIVGEEDASELRESKNEAIAATVTELVNQALGGSSSFDDVAGFIDLGNADPTDDFWTLDPIDGTKGFLRGDQYAIALARIINGQVHFGVLGCPNLSISKDAKPGILLVAQRGEGTWLLPDEGDGAPVKIAAEAKGNLRFCEPFESGHAAHDVSAKVAEVLGITEPPVRMDSQAKYAAVASGMAHIYMRLPRDEVYKEKIWDHAAGAIVIEEAGGKLTDVSGKPLDFTQGRKLQNNAGIVASKGFDHAKIIEAIAGAKAN